MNFKNWIDKLIAITFFVSLNTFAQTSVDIVDYVNKLGLANDSTNRDIKYGSALYQSCTKLVGYNKFFNLKKQPSLSFDDSDFTNGSGPGQIGYFVDMWNKLLSTKSSNPKPEKGSSSPPPGKGKKDNSNNKNKNENESKETKSEIADAIQLFKAMNICKAVFFLTSIEVTDDERETIRKSTNGSVPITCMRKSSETQDYESCLDVINMYHTSISANFGMAAIDTYTTTSAQIQGERMIVGSPGSTTATLEAMKNQMENQQSLEIAKASLKSAEALALGSFISKKRTTNDVIDHCKKYFTKLVGIPFLCAYSEQDKNGKISKETMSKFKNGCNATDFNSDKFADARAQIEKLNG
ncbi:MAG: hypothetical protein U0T83_00690 [Bacteriovoracaceae bacterium]